ncbi:MAG: LytR family transcriptional regulator [Microbacteriaceae bacterium]|nr:LytR family transcriptional regulator [Microbacteriaceae bacterium]
MAKKAKPAAPELYGPSDDYPDPLHTQRKRLTGWKLITALSIGVVGVVVISIGTVVGLTVQNLQSSLVTVELPSAPEPLLPMIGEIEGGFNVLVVGSDTRAGQGDGFEFVDTELNDVNLLVHVSENHDHAVVLSFPRDLMLDIPACPQPGGGESKPREMQPLNTTMSIGGLPCVALTLENLMGLDIGYAGLMTFAGVAQLSTAVGGVEVCVSAPLIDPWSGINIPEAGNHTLEGYEALAFLRTRKGVGDGSDLSRISSQQVYMSALVRTLQQDGVLNDVGKLYGIAQVAAQTMVLSTSLGSVDVMVAMARALRGIPNEDIVFIQYPVLDADPERYPGRVVSNESLAAQVSAKLQADESFTVAADSSGYGSTQADGAAPEEPAEGTDSAVVEGLVGQTAGDETCTVPR